MFTGIVEETGMVERVQKGRSSAVLTVQARKVLEGTAVGDSICVNGVCLTVTALANDRFSADVMHETLNRSSLARLCSGSRVNLERAMRADGRFGGHMVSGHVDGVGRITEIRRDDTAIWYTVQSEPHLLRYIVEKGSVAVDGISLTVAGVNTDSVQVSVIPHTVQMTTLGERRSGDLVNIENDVIGKYVERLLAPLTYDQPKSTVTKEFLARCGY